jgi:hypothetical protein
MNGHNMLATKLRKNNIDYIMHDNAFLEISDFERAQELSDKIRVEDLHRALDFFAFKVLPCYR